VLPDQSYPIVGRSTGSCDAGKPSATPQQSRTVRDEPDRERRFPGNRTVRVSFGEWPKAGHLADGRCAGEGRLPPTPDLQGWSWRRLDVLLSSHSPRRFAIGRGGWLADLRQSRDERLRRADSGHRHKRRPIGPVRETGRSALPLVGPERGVYRRSWQTPRLSIIPPPRSSKAGRKLKF